MLAAMNLWDTAALYGIGSSENSLGKLLRQSSRNDILISTKFTT